MRSRFDEQLQMLNTELITMGALCEDIIACAAKNIFSESDEHLDFIMTADKEIDQKERDIETLCMKLLLRQQPVARDLRMISAAMKMISDMERIGDQAADIAEISKYIKKQGDTHLHIEDMAKATIKMVTRSVTSFVDRDVVLAKEVIRSDDIVDELFLKVKHELVELISANPQLGEFSIDLLMIAKYFERIGDHATNIAEWVEFGVTGIYKGDPL